MGTDWDKKSTAVVAAAAALAAAKAAGASGAANAAAGRGSLTTLPGGSLVAHLGHGPFLGHSMHLHSGPATFASLASAVMGLVRNWWD